MRVRLSLASRVLIALAAGILLGAVLARAEDPRVLEIPRTIEPVGQLWIRALQMTVIPLAVSLFRISTPPAAVVSALFAARLHGIPLGAADVAGYRS